VRKAGRGFVWRGQLRMGCWGLLTLLVCQGAFAQDVQPSSTPSQGAGQTDLTQMSIENLMNMEVTSVSKKEQRVWRTPAAIFVITPEDIRESGATNVPDLLRMVPGLQVAQINAGTWAITARGFNGQYSNKLLVLVDGRTVYSPIFSGVYWDAQMVPLETVERIEVIRGPGAAVWGANAVNGVINIITLKADRTQGGLITGGGGTHEQGFGTAEFGGKAGRQTNYRLTAGGFNRGHLPDLTGQNGEDDWSVVQGGFRIDTEISSKNALTFEGGGHSGDAGERATTIASIFPPVNTISDLRDHFSGWNVVGRWTRATSEHAETSLQVYFDRTSRWDTTYSTGLNTLDGEFQQRLGLGDRHDLVWGADYRLTSDEIAVTPRIIFNQPEQHRQLFGSFVQDEIAIRPDRVYLTLGARLEHNDFTGFGVQPTAAFTWVVGPRNTVWASVSQALRTPTQSDRGIRFNELALPGPSLPLLVAVLGSSGTRDEHETSYQAGYRTEVGKRLSVDLTAFYNQYRHLTSVEPGTPFPEFVPAPPHLVAGSILFNLSRGETHGMEAAVNWKAHRRWKLSPGYTFLTMHLHRGVGSADVLGTTGAQGLFPSHQAQLRSHVDLRRGWQWNTDLYFVDRLPTGGVPSYTRVDSNVIWQVGERMSISVVGQNLWKDHHLEYQGSDQTQLSSLVKRSGYAKVTWSF
jgi:iron complex outermembrane recepter protein